MPRKSKGKGKGKRKGKGKSMRNDNGKDEETAYLFVRRKLVFLVNFCYTKHLLSLETKNTWQAFANDSAWHISKNEQLFHINQFYSMKGTTEDEELIQQVFEFIPIWQRDSCIWYIGCLESYELVKFLLTNETPGFWYTGTGVKSVLELGGGKTGLHGLSSLCTASGIKYTVTDEKTGWTIENETELIEKEGWTKDLYLCANPYGSMLYSLAEMLRFNPLSIRTTLLMFLSLPLGRQETIKKNDAVNHGQPGCSLTGPILMWSMLFSVIPLSHHLILDPRTLWIADIYPCTPENGGRAVALVVTANEEKAEFIHKQVLDYLCEFKPMSYAWFLLDYSWILDVYKWEELVEIALTIIGEQYPKAVPYYLQEIKYVRRPFAYIAMQEWLLGYENYLKKRVLG